MPLCKSVRAPVVGLMRYSLMRRSAEPNEVLSPSGTKTNCAAGAVVAAVGSALDAPVSWANAVNAKPRATAHVSLSIRVAGNCMDQLLVARIRGIDDEDAPAAARDVLSGSRQMAMNNS